MFQQVLQNFHMLSTWCLLRGLSTILHLGPSGGMADSGKESTAPAAPVSKTKTQTSADAGAPVTTGPVKTRESAAAAAGTGRPSTGKM